MAFSFFKPSQTVADSRRRGERSDQTGRLSPPEVMAQPSPSTDQARPSATDGSDDPAPSTALQKEAPSIRPIGASSVHRICSGQVVLDLAGAVKELVENALDAGATNIEVRLRDHGQDSVEVVDNGCGVKSDDLAMMTKKYATSKIRHFEDLDALASFGFRGEALSSLCALSDLSVTTRTADSDAGTRVEYDAEGNVRTRGVVARAVGTTVTVQNVFARLPVRRKELARNVKREYGKLLNILQAYALINPETRIVCSHQGKGKNAPRQTVLNTQGGGSLRAAVATVFGHKTSSAMLEVREDLGEGCGARIDGMVSKAAPGCGRGAGDRQFFFVNGRPVDLPKAARVCNETYRQYNQTTSGTPFPCVVLDFRLPTDAYDVNVTPDKRKVLLHGESKVLAGLRGALEKIWSPSVYTYAVAAAGAVDGSETTRVRVHDAIGTARDVIAGGPSAATPALPPASAVGVKREREEDDDAMVVAPSVDVKREPAEDRVLRGLSAAASAWESFGMNAPPNNTANDATTTANDPRTNPAIEHERYQPRTREGATQRGLASFGFTRELDGVGIGGGWRFRARRVANGGERDGERDDDEDEEEEEEEEDDPNDGDYRAGGSPGGVPEDDGEEEEEEEEEGDGANRDVPARVDRDAFVKPEPVDDAVDFDFHEGAARAPLVHHGAPLAFSLAALRERRAAVRNNRRGSRPGRDPLVHGNGDGKGGADRPDVSVHGSSKYAAASFGVEPGPAREIVADEDGESPGGDSPGGAREASTGRDARRVGERSSDGGEGEEGGLGPALNEGGDEVATGELERVFRREDFRDMRVVGQFNLGFILCTLGDDLFIVDQHASDEIYNFERLQRTTTLNRQPLLVPKKLELTAAETQTVHRNMPTFLANGFGFCEVDQPPPTVRSLALNSVPFSKGITFGADDVHELIGMLDQGEYALPARSQLTVGLSRQSTGTPGSGLSVSEIVRPSRVRAMLAMRACRSSIMIGKALDAKTMRRVLDNLSDLQAPWNCPHGRPTMRHLADLRKLRKWSRDGAGGDGGGWRRGFGNARKKVKGGIGGW